MESRVLLRAGAAARAAAVAVVSVALLAGCDGGGTPSGDPSATKQTASSSAGASSSASSNVAPATGRQISTKVLSYRIPAGPKWMYIRPDGTYAQYYDADGLWVVSSISTYAGQTALDAMARAAMQADVGDWPKKNIRRVANRTVDGHEGYAIVAHGPNGWMYEWGTAVGHDWPSLVFNMPAYDARARRMIDSVMASVVWKK